MAVITAIARAVSNLALGNQDITDASFGGGIPKACILLWSNAIADGVAASNARSSYGMATGASNQGCMSFNSEDAQVVTSDCRCDLELDKIIDIRNPGSSTVEGVAVFVSFITDGIRIEWTDTAPVAGLITVVLLGGDDFQAHVDNYALGALGSTVDTTAPGFQPNVVLSFSVFANGSNSLRIGTGIAWDDEGSITQILWADHHNNSSNPTDVTQAIFNNIGGGLKNRTDGTNPFFGILFSDFDANGFTTEVTQADASPASHLYLAMDFGPNPVFFGTYVTPASTGDDAEAVGFKPQLAFLFILEQVVAFNTQTRGGSEGVAVFNETSEFCQSISDEDGLDPTVNPTNTRSRSSAKALDVPDGSGTLEAVATLASFDDDGYTLNYTIVPSTQRAYLQFIIGTDPVAPAVTPALINRIRGDEMGAVIQIREFLELTSAASRVETKPFHLGGNAWEVQFKAPASLCGIEGSNDLQEWDTMNDILGLPIVSKNSATFVGLERPKYLRFFVDTDVGEPQTFSAVIAVQKQQGS